MRRILVIGSGGAGKSRLARELGKALGLPVIHLDAHYWKPGWVETPRREWDKTVAELLRRDAWVMDGNYGATFATRLKAADTVIFLNYSRWLCLWRGLKRQFLRQRVDVIPGCHEKMDAEFIRWIWNYPRKGRPRIMRMLQEGGDGKRIYICNTPRQAKRLLKELKPTDKRRRGNNVSFPAVRGNQQSPIFHRRTE